MASLRKQTPADRAADNRALVLLDAIHTAFRDVSEEEVLADLVADELDEHSMVESDKHTEKPGAARAPRDAA